MKNSRIIFFFVALAAGIILLAPFHDFQSLLSQGDHGRDLYAFEQTMHGAKAYKDYWWVYGPLMPYYYALFFKWFGISAASALLGKLILNLLSGLFLFLGFSRIFSPVTALLVSLWFWSFNSDFFFTYNHAGGITFICATLFTLFGYLESRKVNYLWWGLIALFLLCFVKVNIGLACLGSFVAGVFLIDLVYRVAGSRQKLYFYVASLLVLPGLVLIGYLWSLTGLTIMEIRQCLPYIKGDQPYSVDPLVPFKIIYETTIGNIRLSWSNFIAAVIIVGSIGQSLWLVTSPTTDPSRRKTIGLTLGILFIFLVANIHEFFLSGVFYRYFWVKPFQIGFLSAAVAFAGRDLPRAARAALAACVLLSVTSDTRSKYEMISTVHTPQHFLDHDRLRIYTTNPPDWYETVKTTADYLKKNLKPDELFFALPYDPIYYYLAGKRSPTRQLIFFEHILIPQEQEFAVIAELEKNHTNYVVLSSRMAASEHGLGILGITYCPIIARYLNDHFETLVKIGDWSNDPGWGWYHGTMILKRKKPL